MATGYFGQDRAERMARQDIQQRWMAAYAPLRHIDFSLIVATLALTAIGVVMIYSAKLETLRIQDLAGTFYVSKQLIALAVGTVTMGLVAAFDYRWLRSYGPIIYVASMVLLVVVLTSLGTEVNGAQGWFRVGGLQFQPAEIGKLGVVVALAALFQERKDEADGMTVLTALLVVGIPTVLVFIQPDFGSAIIYVWILFVVMLVAGTAARYLLGLTAAGVAGFVGGLQLDLIRDYQLERLTSFLHAGEGALSQGSGFHLEQSLIAVGSGQLFGKGLFNGTQTSLSFVPENHTDFIFTVISEEFGFLGAAVVLGLFAVLIWRGIRISMMSKDVFGALLAAGIVAVWSLQVFVNVGMTIGIMPVTGIPLPFISYGGTSLILQFVFTGILLNIHMRRF